MMLKKSPLLWVLLMTVMTSVSLKGQEPQKAPLVVVEPEASPTPSLTPNPPPVSSPPQAPAASPTPDPGAVRLKADSQEVIEKGHYHARGFVDLQAGETRIQADTLDLYEILQTDGGISKEIVAEGNVVFIRGEERMAGKRLTMNLDTGQGTFEHAMGYIQPGVFIEGDSIERLDPTTYRIKNGRFTSCAQPNPRWGFTARSAKIEVDDKIIAKNVFFRVKEVPAFYIPYFIYPIKEDQRSTGFLFPTFGYSSDRGFNLGMGFFWAMGRSFDQTFYADHYSQFGYGFGNEFRYILMGQSRGNFKSYAFRKQIVEEDGKEWEYEFTWNAIQRLPGAFRVNLNVSQLGSQSFQRRFQDNLDRASSRGKVLSFNAQRAFGATNFQLSVEDRETRFAKQTQIQRRLPTARLTQSPKKIRRTGILFSYDARMDNLGIGNRKRVENYSRFDIAPEISRPFGLSFLQASPRIQLRATRYGATSAEDGFPTGPPLSRRYFESGLEIRGPKFFQVFNNPGGFYSEKFKHEISPEVTWTYRTAVTDFDLIPKFEDMDQYLGTDQLRYALVQTLWAKRPGPSGKLIPQAFLTWTVAQTYYVQIAASGFDRNYISSDFGVGGEPAHYSPIQSNLTFRPTPGFDFTYNLEYDTNFQRVRNFNIRTKARNPRGELEARWFRGNDLANNIRSFDTLRGSAKWEVLPGVKLSGLADYDIVKQQWIQYSAQARYDVQCCGFMVEALESAFILPKKRQIRFSIELANIGSVGNFTSGEPAKR